MIVDRRRLMRALGLGTLSSLPYRNVRALADGGRPPSRIVFFIQPHGHVPPGWNMPIPGAAPGQFAERSLIDLKPEDLGEAIRPLHPYRDRLTVVEGLAHTSVLMDIAEVKREGMGDFNNHAIAVSGLLTGARAAQTAGLPCLGGARSLDQELAIRTAGPGRFGSRVYGSDYVPNATVAPFSYLGPKQATPIVGDPGAAFKDLLGYYVPPNAANAPKTRADTLRTMRPSVLDAVGKEYEMLSKQLGAGGRRKLEQHRALIRELELNLGLEAPATPLCDPKLDDSGHAVTQFMRLIKLAFTCDLTRVVTFVAPVPQPPEFGYAPDINVHAHLAHASIRDHTACGAPFLPLAERAMIDLGAWYARHIAFLLQELDSVVEGGGTLLDHTVVVWLTELGTPTHQHEDTFTLLAGGCNGFFNTGRYLRYPRALPNPIVDFPPVGPAQNRLFVSLMQAMGVPNDAFGMTDAAGADGTPISLRGPLTELHRS